MGDLTIEAFGPPPGTPVMGKGPIPSGDTRQQKITEFAQKIDLTRPILEDYRRVSDTFPAERRGNASWAAHREIQRRTENVEEAHALVADRDDWP